MYTYRNVVLEEEEEVEKQCIRLEKKRVKERQQGSTKWNRRTDVKWIRVNERECVSEKER